MVAYLPAASTMEIQLTSGQFDSSLFAMANGGDFAADSDFKFWKNATIYPTAGSATFTYAGTLTPADISINGMSQGSSASGKATYKVAVDASTSTVTLTFATGEGGFADTDPIEVNWKETRTNAVSLDVTNSQAAIGEAILKWPKHIWAA